MSLKLLRRNAGISQIELAHATGLNVRTIQRLEQGHRASLKTLQALSVGLALPVESLKQHVSIQEAHQERPERMVFLDNLRSFLVFLVVLYHCGIVYESSGIGAYFWLVDDGATNDLSGVFNLVIDTFVMFGLFFIAGFFTQPSVQNKPVKAFILARFKRLILPWLFAVVTLLPLYKMIFLASRGMPQETWTSYFHVSNGIISQSWLWFLPILFLFELAFLGLSRIRHRFSVVLPELSIRQLIAVIFAISVLVGATFQVTGLNGWTKTWLFDFQNERLLSYFLVFVLGAVFNQRQLFQQPWQTKRLTMLVNCTAWLPINLYLAMVIYSLINSGNYLFSPFVDAALKHTFLQLSMLGLLYSAIVCCKRFFDSPTRIGNWVSQNSYGTYIIHTIVLGAIALALQPLVLPSLVKYLLLVTATYTSCQIIVSLYKMTTTNVQS